MIEPPGPDSCRRVEQRDRPRPTPALVCVVLWGVVGLACATGGGSPLPRGASRLAVGSTPEPVRYEVVVAGPAARVRVRLVRVLSDSLFHVNQADPGALTAYNLARLLKVRVEVSRVGKDSVRIGLTGETYAGDTARRDSVSGLPEQWRLITATDGGAALLRGLARSLRLNRGDFRTALETNGSDQTSSPVPVPAGSTADPEVLAVLARTPVGRAVEVCRSASVPSGWLILYWFEDRSRCTRLPDERYPGEPNAMRIERQW
jgi:hypothetical protein